jgi:hypothetical protein
MICLWCNRDNGKTGQSVEARLCPYCGRYGPDESVVDAIGFCQRCGYTGSETVCPSCGPQQLDPWTRACLKEALERRKERAEHPELEDDDIPF